MRAAILGVLGSSDPPIHICFGCGGQRPRGDEAPCRRCGEPPLKAVWLPGDHRGPASGVEVALSVAASGLLLAPAALYGCLIAELTFAALREGEWAVVGAAIVALAALGPVGARWVTERLFELWGRSFTYCAVDGTRWGTVRLLFGRFGIGDGVCMTALQPTAAGATPLSSSDAINAGLPIVAAHLSRLQGATGEQAFGPFDALMLATFAGLAARGSATISRGRVLRWRRDWFRRTERAAPEAVLTIERARDDEDGGPVEGPILDTLQAMEHSLTRRPREVPVRGYREAPVRLPPVRMRLDDALRAPAVESAAAAAVTPGYGGAPFAVAVAIDDFARRDPDRMVHLRRLLTELRPR